MHYRWSIVFGAGALALVGVERLGHAYSPGSPATLSAVPAGYTECGKDFSVCKVPVGVPISVVYGEGSKYVSAEGTGDFTCLPKSWVKTPGSLGVDDPSPGKVKTCYMKALGPKLLSSVPRDYVPCGKDGDTCKTTGDVTVVYGVDGKFAASKIIGGEFTCLPKGGNHAPAPLDVDDPWPGKQKTCYLPNVVAGVQVQWTKCSLEYDTAQTSSYAIPEQLECRFPKQAANTVVTVRLVAGRRASYIPVSGALGSLPCNNKLFGDPAWGEAKVCEYTTANLFPTAQLDSGWTHLVHENQTQHAESTYGASGPSDELGWVRYGTGDNWILSPIRKQPLVCSNTGLFDGSSGLSSRTLVTSDPTTGFSQTVPKAVSFDPAPGRGKVCETKPLRTKPAFTRCATENTECVVPGYPEIGEPRYVVRYGDGDRWVHRILSGPRFMCNNALMSRDPAYGAGKSCYIMML